jgi:outer membrane PBP1 activator LpoA protein
MLHAPDRRPQGRLRWLALLFTVVLLAMPAEQAAASRRDDIAAAEKNAREGRHAEAARLYDKASERRILGTDRTIALLAAREYLAAGQVNDAERMANEAGKRRLNDQQAMVYAEVRAGIALARNQPEAALAALGDLPEPLPPALKSLREQALAMIESARAPVIAAEPEPVETFVPGAPGLAILPLDQPSHIALLLPLSGRLEALGEAVRDGFAAAWLARSPENRPRIEIYDTAASGAVAAFNRALSEGARFVVGPLARPEVQAIVNESQIPVPVLALNAYEAVTPPAFLFSYALDPEEEARAVARRIAADGLSQGVALFPQSDWGERVRTAFTDEALLSGLTLTSVQTYDAASADFSGPLRSALGRFGGAGDRGTGARPAPRRDSAAEALEGPQFVFLAANARTASALTPQLRFQMTYRVPVYATSDAWVAGASSGNDFEGMVFPEIPWVLYDGQGAPQLWDTVHGTWSSKAPGRLRLFAFGYDAYLLMNELRGNVRHVGVSGLTGGLEMTESGRVTRRLDFARIENGTPRPAGRSESLFAPSAP